MKLLQLLLPFSLIIVSFFYFKSGNIKSQPDFRDDFLLNKTLNERDLRPYEWEYIKRTYPYLDADPRAYLDAIEEAHLLREETRQRYFEKGLAVVQWEFIGPENVGGRVVDLEFNPQNPNIIYAGFATGGVFKSTDLGVNWFSVFDDQAVLTIGDIAIDPLNPDVIYVGTGEANGGHNNFPGGGVFKSTDAGSSWNYIGLYETVSIGRILIDPLNSNVVYLAAVGSYFSPNPQRGVFKSTDGGTTWNQSLFVSDSTGTIDIIMDPSDPNKIMAAMWERVRRPTSSHLYGPSSGIYKTTDGGTNWNLIPPSTGLPNSNSQNVGRIGLAISKSNPEIVYSLYTNGSQIISLFKSNNFGDNWQDVDPDNELNGGTGGFSWYFGQVRVHPTNPDIVYVLDVSFMRSSNSGTTWTENYQTHVDHHALAFNPTNPDYLILGNDGGINISNNAGINWGPHHQIPATQFYEIGLDASNSLAYYGGTQDNGTNRTLDGGLDNWEHIFGGDGFYVLVDFVNPNIIYAESQFGNLGKSTDGGNSFDGATNGINSNEPTNWDTPVIMDPNNSNILYYGTDYLYRTNNAAGSWNKISPKLTDYSGGRLGTITTIAVAPSNSNVIYVGTDDSHVWESSDNAATWTEVSDGLPIRWVTRVVVDPMNENIVYVTFNGLKWKDPQPHVFRSTDKGTSWSDISSNLPDAPVNAFAVDNLNPHQLYLGNDVGMYISYNSGQSWQVLGEGLPVIPVGDIEIHSSTNQLVAGTYGRSMYKIDLDLVSDIRKDEINLENFVLEQNYPNPFNPSTKIKYTVHQSSNVTMNVFDILGNKIETLVYEQKPMGTYEIIWYAENLPSGIYFYKLQVGDFAETKKMVLLK